MILLILALILSGAFGVILACLGIGATHWGFWVLLGIYLLYGIVNHFNGFIKNIYPENWHDSD